MLSHAKTLFQQVRDDLPLGTSNAADSAPNIKELGDFGWLVGNKISQALSTIFASAKLTEGEFLILSCMAEALLAQAYQCASCPGQASLVFVKALESETNFNKEVIQLKGAKYLKTDFFGLTPTGQSIMLRFHSHFIFVLGRDEKKSKLEDVSTWSDVCVVDTWQKGAILECKNAERLDPVKLVGGYFEPDQVISFGSAKVKFRAADWDKYSDLLAKLQKYIQNHFHNWFDEAKRKVGDKKRELSAINQVFAKKIRLYQHLANKQKFVITHYGKNPNLLYQRVEFKAVETVRPVSNTSVVPRVKQF